MNTHRTNNTERTLCGLPIADETNDLTNTDALVTCETCKNVSRNEKRVALERRIVRRYLSTLIDAGFTLEVNDGGVTYPRTVHVSTALDQVRAVDDATVYAIKDGVRGGALYFVQGNAPYEVLNDYSCSLEDVLAPANAYAESFDIA